MNCYELIKANQSLLQLMKENQITVNDVETMQIYEDFRSMKKKEHKTVYCVVVLADRYGKSQRTIYNIIDHFRKKVSV